MNTLPEVIVKPIEGCCGIGLSVANTWTLLATYNIDIDNTTLRLCKITQNNIIRYVTSDFIYHISE